VIDDAFGQMMAAYDATPAEVRRLFCESSEELEEWGTWLHSAMRCGPVPLFDFPAWVTDLLRAPINVPTIQCAPDKSPGTWRIYHAQHQWHVTSEELRDVCEKFNRRGESDGT
jgi:hypothetical protein